MTLGQPRNEYGYCPLCCKPVMQRERGLYGNDKCEMGHEYPTEFSDKEPNFGEAMCTANETIDFIIQSDAPRTHEQLSQLAEWLESTLDRVNRMELA